LIQDLYKLLGGQAPLSTLRAREDKVQEATPPPAESPATVSDLTNRLVTLEKAFHEYKTKFDDYHAETNPILLALARVLSEDEDSKISVLKTALPSFIEEVRNRLGTVENAMQIHTSDITRLDKTAKQYMRNQFSTMSNLVDRIAQCEADVGAVRQSLRAQTGEDNQGTLTARVTELQDAVKSLSPERGLVMYRSGKEYNLLMFTSLLNVIRIMYTVFCIATGRMASEAAGYLFMT
jgi:hypothetical protein